MAELRCVDCVHCSRNLFDDRLNRCRRSTKARIDFLRMVDVDITVTPDFCAVERGSSLRVHVVGRQQYKRARCGPDGRFFEKRLAIWQVIRKQLRRLSI